MQFAKGKRLLEAKQHPSITIHGLGAAINRAINLVRNHSCPAAASHHRIASHLNPLPPNLCSSMLAMVVVGGNVGVLVSSPAVLLQTMLTCVPTLPLFFLDDATFYTGTVSGGLFDWLAHAAARQ